MVEDAEAKGQLTPYLLSLPERTLRSVAAVSAGLAREIGDTALPAPVRRSRLYRTMVDATLRFLIEQVGEVQGAYPAEGRLSRSFAARRAAGNGLEVIGVLLFRASPVWVMAALADVCGAGRTVLREIGTCLEEEGLIESGARYETMDQLLDALEQTSERVAETVNTPPLDVASLRREWSEIGAAVKKIPPARMPSPAQLQAQWEKLRSVAASESRSVFQLSAVMAVAALQKLPENLLWLSRSAQRAARRTTRLFAEPLLEHYSHTLDEIREAGFLAYWTRQFRPYLLAAASQFRRESVSSTERWLGRGKTTA
jgi:hypothetical protein